jgi:ubiquinone biosynthesis protein COQ9
MKWEMTESLEELIALREAERHNLLAAALGEIPFEGWSRRALTQGAQSIGLPAIDVDRLFPGGPVEAIEFWNAEADQAVLDAFAAVNPGAEHAALRVRDKITFGVRARIEPLFPHREAVRRGLGLMALPQNASTAATLLYRTVDTIWHGAGDTSTDWNFYSKRALLAGVYTTTLVHWLDDASEDCAETWAFLDRRIENVMGLPRLMGQFQNRLKAGLRPLFRPSR